MPVYLHHIETWNPPYTQPQDVACERVMEQYADKKTRRILRHIYKQSEIDNRFTCLPFRAEVADPLFASDSGKAWANPGTGDRNRIYSEISRKASVDLARLTLEASAFTANDITHVVTASCTGFYNPGPDYHLIRELGLSTETGRFHLGFMGCYAAFPALRLANSICQHDPDAVVIIQCLELCSLHLQLDPENMEAMVAASLFADGAGCALISARSPLPGKNAFRLEAFASTLTPDGEEDMAWEIGNHGFDIVLSGYVPKILGENIRSAVFPFLKKEGVDPEAVCTWAVHPGGKAILDQVARALDLSEQRMHLSRDILRQYGNMSSATLLFLLKEALASGQKGLCTAMAFGPGLTVEMGLLQMVTGEKS